MWGTTSALSPPTRSSAWARSRPSQLTGTPQDPKPWNHPVTYRCSHGSCRSVDKSVRGKITGLIFMCFVKDNLVLDSQGGEFARRATILNGGPLLSYFYDDAKTMYEFFLRGQRLSSTYCLALLQIGTNEQRPMCLKLWRLPVVQWQQALCCCLKETVH